MKLLDTLLREFFVFLGKVLQIIPLIWIEEIHQIEEFTNIVVQRGLEAKLVKYDSDSRDTKITNTSENDSMNSVQFIEFLEDKTCVTFHCRTIFSRGISSRQTNDLRL